eukprot:UN29661
MSAMTSLLLFNGSHNQLTAPDEFWTGLGTVQKIDLEDNAISGTVPDSLAETKVHHVDFSDNEITAIPQSFSGTAQSILEYIDFSNNKLAAGPLPTDYSNILQLTHLNLAMNKYTGNIPSDWMHLTKLRGLNVSHNALTGTLSPDLKKLKGLKQFDVSFNDFTGKLSST